MKVIPIDKDDRELNELSCWKRAIEKNQTYLYVIDTLLSWEEGEYLILSDKLMDKDGVDCQLIEHCKFDELQYLRKNKLERINNVL